jgi:hypothetical protein
MSDNLNDKGSQDRKLISLEEDWEVKYWTEALACSVMELKDAVAAVGHSAQKVREYLERSHTSNP